MVHPLPSFLAFHTLCVYVVCLCGRSLWGTVLICRKDITLLELSKLIAPAFPNISKPNTRLAFRLLFTDSWRPRVLLKDVGTVVMSPPQDPNSSSSGGGGGGEDAGSRTLEDVKYVIGDWIDVAIFNNSQGGSGSRPYDGPR